MTKSRRNHIIKGLITLSLLAGAIVFLYFVPPEKIVDTLGIGNAFLVLFVLSIFSAISTLTATPFYVALFAFVQGGLNPFVMALVVAPGVTFGDYLFFLMMKKTIHNLSAHRKWITRLTDWAERQKPAVIHWAIFLVYAFIPISSDIYLSVMAIANLKTRDMLVPLFAGNLVFFSLIGIAAMQNYTWVQKIFA